MKSLTSRSLSKYKTANKTHKNWANTVDLEHAAQLRVFLSCHGLTSLTSVRFWLHEIRLSELDLFFRGFRLWAIAGGGLVASLISFFTELSFCFSSLLSFCSSVQVHTSLVLLLCLLLGEESTSFLVLLSLRLWLLSLSWGFSVTTTVQVQPFLSLALLIRSISSLWSVGCRV